MSTRNRKILFMGSEVLLATYRHLWANCLDNVGSITSHNPIGLHCLLRGQHILRPLGRPRRRWVDNITVDGVMWTGLVWLRIGTGGELLSIRYWTFGFHEMLGNYREASWVVLSSIELDFSLRQYCNAKERHYPRHCTSCELRQGSGVPARCTSAKLCNGVE
jgi:hypothetical protein